MNDKKQDTNKKTPIGHEGKTNINDNKELDKISQKQDNLKRINDKTKWL